MTDGGAAMAAYRAGDTLLWEVRRNQAQAAEDVASELGELADAHSLGEWEIIQIGLGQGEACWFDLRLAKDVDILFLKLVIGRLPCLVY